MFLVRPRWSGHRLPIHVTERSDVPTEAAMEMIRRVIAERQFVIYLQPIVDLEGRQTVAVEALTRFTDGAPPDGRFAEAAALGLGHLLERATLAAALDTAESLPSAVALSINLSADLVQHERLLPSLFEGVGRTVIIELSERERIDDYDAVRSALDRLGPRVELAIDDAGSGVANMRHIDELQPAFVKVGIESVRGVDGDPARQALVSSLVSFCDATGCMLVAKGIETEAELAALRAMGVKLGQGFLLGRPLPPAR